ncbi:large ribosomal subunit protein uL22 [Blattabacterium cuenoti]|uniref:large ribosomal subunit protein uL22 n=1 Tax=Blattabacterium cuenoti TaxID=1653831 RepID=UPI00163BDA83|nr:uL22 family ribosomal protein [Blattabacterium cuenoti]
MEDKAIISASLNEVRSAPRKMRLLVNLIRNKEIQKALDILKYSKKQKVSSFLRKLLLSVLSNWHRKYPNLSFSDKKSSLYIKKITVNQGKTLKRLRPVPQGRGHRIRKKSSKILVFLEKR